MLTIGLFYFWMRSDLARDICGEQMMFAIRMLPEPQFLRAGQEAAIAGEGSDG